MRRVGRELLCVFAFAACSAREPNPPCVDLGGGSGAAGSLTVEAYCGVVIRARCERAAACGLSETVEGCMAASQRDPALRFCDVLPPGVKAGRIAFDCAAAADCVAAPTASCTAPTSCEHVSAGRVAVDGDCFSQAECVAGAWCDWGLATCPGKCTRRLDENEVYAHGRCREDLVPIIENFSTVKTFRCIRRKELGEACTGLTYPGVNVCAAGLTCSSWSGVCEQPRGPDAGCADRDAGVAPIPLCAEGLSCQLNAASEMVCLPPPPPGALGQPCGTCKLDLRCLGPDGGAACSALREQGEACTQDADCNAGLFCMLHGEGAPRECGPAGDLGAPCSNLSCKAGLYCASVFSGAVIVDHQCEELTPGLVCGSCPHPDLLCR